MEDIGSGEGTVDQSHVEGEREGGGANSDDSQNGRGRSWMMGEEERGGGESVNGGEESFLQTRVFKEAFVKGTMKLHGKAGDVARRKLGLLTALEKLEARRAFHYEHISTERIITHSAFEVAANYPSSVIAFAADGFSKEKTKLPYKEKSKNDETVNRKDCFVTSLVMSIANVSPGETKTRSEKTAESKRLRELRSLHENMEAHPDSYTDDEKTDVEMQLQHFVDMDEAAASGYTFFNHDFLYPFGFGGVPQADALVSNILHVLQSDQVTLVPPCMVVVLDNASVNKSKHSLRAFGLLLELIPRLREVHLMFPSVGHTHNCVDGHFGRLCTLMKGENIGTPHDLARVFEKARTTKAHISFPYYQFSRLIDSSTDVHEFSFIGHQ
ncbi:hypothetical protein PMAYCL1PPCAC_23978, partial [Pristionchus mayeri]